MTPSDAGVILARFYYVTALARVRDRDDWRSILAAIQQDPAARIASRAEAVR